MRRPRAALPFALLGCALALASCAPALRGPEAGPTLAADLGVAGSAGDPTTVDGLLGAAEASWARRPDVGAVREAARLFGRAALADEGGVAGLLGYARAVAWRIEREGDAKERERLATASVRAGERCLGRSPGNPACEYALAIALGQQARERPATALDGLKEMVAALERAIAGDERQDLGGPHRVLALVQLRAPGWPSGPGDPDAGLEEARKAEALFPEHPPNVLALGEALEKTGDPDGAREAYRRASALASRLASGGDPDAAEWLEEARRVLSRPGS
ncbi:MAG: hypothetical protein EDX89_17740 [Acidobacteria bacterium]|nr:MAG: hypothetical protein EDX89_17740 [Acidobacteriota bacterium]